MTQKFLTKMQISPIKNQNFEKPSRNLSNRTKVKILKKKFWISLKKIWFEHRNSGENRWKRSEIFSKIYEGHVRIWFRSKKFKIISCLCTFNEMKRKPREKSQYWKKYAKLVQLLLLPYSSKLWITPFFPSPSPSNPSLSKPSVSYPWSVWL